MFNYIPEKNSSYELLIQANTRLILIPSLSYSMLLLVSYIILILSNMIHYELSILFLIYPIAFMLCAILIQKTLAKRTLTRAYKFEFNKEINYDIKFNFIINNNGISIESSDCVISYKWDSIKKINIFKDYFLISFKNRDIESRIFVFKFFSEPDSSIISELKKYKKVF